MRRSRRPWRRSAKARCLTRKKILWSHDAGTPYRYYIDDSRAFWEFWHPEESGTTFSPAAWSEVAETLRARLDDEAFVESAGYHALAHHVDGACEAFWRAGRGEEAFALRRKFAAKTGSWRACADDLCRLGRREDAKSFLLEAREFVRSPDAENWEDGSDLIEKLADIYAEDGECVRAAALMAECWLSIAGGIDVCGNDFLFGKVLDAAEKAGVRSSVRIALFYAVDTRTAPAGIPTHDPAFPPSKRRLPPPPFVQDRAPPWPLPPSGLDFGIPSCIIDGDGFWWEAEAMLVRIALAEGDRADAARRFAALPPRPGGYSGVSREDGLNDFERHIQVSLSGDFPAVAERIAATQEYRSWTRSHVGQKLPKELRDRLYPLLNVRQGRPRNSE